ncbi:MAG: hypothetical protein ACLFNQ_12875 [Spirochaetaceae bacterium]
MAKQTKKTTPRKKTTAPEPAAEPPANTTKRIDQITRLLHELDENALEYIASQVAMLVQQQRHERTQDAVVSAQDSVMHGEAPAGAGTAASQVDIEQISPQSFVIKVAGERVFFSKDELRAVAKIAWAADDPATGAERMYRWFNRERSDFLLDTGIDGVRDRALEALYEIIRSRYRVK